LIVGLVDTSPASSSSSSPPLAAFVVALFPAVVA